jgi:hypothetical protein
MRTDQDTRSSAVRGLILACVVSLIMWMLIAVFLRGKTPIW